MRSFRMLILIPVFSGALLAAGSAGAQMYPGQGVTVNPSAAGTRVLLYPGNQYVRVLPPLAEPGAAPLEPIHLHMPVHHGRVARAHHHAAKVATETQATDTAPAADAAPAPDAAPDTAPAETPAPPAHRTRRKKVEEKKVEAAAAQPAPETPAPADDGSSAAIPFSFGGAPPPPSRPAPRQAPKPTKVATAEAPPDRTAAQPSAAKSSESGFTKRGEILFKHDATDPAPAQYDGLKLLAGDLNSALQSGATRIHLDAFGGTPGDKGSDARRLSLKRALAIRQVLIDNGVPSGKIDVSAMGGIDDHGNADRVDVLVQGG
ncbi:MAG: OmpA family protein [Rhizomicrobium sp.]